MNPKPSDFVVIPIRLAAKYQREHMSGYNHYDDMTSREAIACMRHVAWRARADAALARWEGREIDDRKS